MTSLLDRPITAVSDDGVCRWRAAKLWQTHAIKYEIIEVASQIAQIENVLKFGQLVFFSIFKP